jgi:YVTN family beta-propeller protein
MKEVNKEFLLGPINRGRVLAIFASGICLLLVSSGLAQPGDSPSTDAALPKNTISKIVTVQPDAEEIVVSPDSSTLYVVGESPAPSISVIDVKNDYVVKATIPLSSGSYPIYLALTPDGKTLYVTNGSDPGAVSVIDVTQMNYPVIATINVEIYPQRVAVSPDGKEAYIANPTQGTISVIATATNQVTATINCKGNPFLPLFTGNGKQVDVLNEAGTGFVQLINPISGVVSTSVAGGGAFMFPTGMTTDRSGSTLYITSQYNCVVAMRASDGAVTKEILAASNSFSFVSLGQPALTPSGKYLYVPANRELTPPPETFVTMIDVVTGQIVGPLINLADPPFWAQTSPDGKNLYVSSLDGTLTVIDITQ